MNKEDWTPGEEGKKAWYRGLLIVWDDIDGYFYVWQPDELSNWHLISTPFDTLDEVKRWIDNMWTYRQ